MTKCELRNVNGVQYPKWMEEIDLSGNPITSISCVAENNQWRGMIALLNLSETQIPLAEMSVLANLSCQIETLDVSRTPADTEKSVDAQLADVFAQCRSIRYIQITGRIISTDELTMQRQHIASGASWTVRSFGLPPELEK